MNPWRLQAWLGHKRIDETMLYAHPRQLPVHVRKASRRVADPDARVLAMLGARGADVTTTSATSGLLPRLLARVDTDAGSIYLAGPRAVWIVQPGK